MTHEQLVALNEDKYKNTVYTFQLTFSKYVVRKGNGAPYPRIQLEFSRAVADGLPKFKHVFANYTKKFAKLGLMKRGDIVTAKAGLNKYIFNRSKYYYRDRENGTKYISPILYRPKAISRVKPKRPKRDSVPDRPILQTGWYLATFPKAQNDLYVNTEYFLGLYRKWRSNGDELDKRGVHSWSRSYNQRIYDQTKTDIASRDYARVKDYVERPTAYVKEHKMCAVNGMIPTRIFTVARYLMYTLRDGKFAREARADSPGYEFVGLKAMADIFRYYRDAIMKKTRPDIVSSDSGVVLADLRKLKSLNVMELSSATSVVFISNRADAQYIGSLLLTVNDAVMALSRHKETPVKKSTVHGDYEFTANGRTK